MRKYIPEALDDIAQFIWKLIKNFNHTNGTMRAASLSYTLLLSFIPFTIVVFTIISWIPFTNFYINRVEHFVFTNYLPNGHDVYRQIKVFLHQSGGLSILGFSSLFLTSYMMLFSLEKHINALWLTHRRASFWKSLGIHSVFIILGPTVIIAVLLLRIYSHVFLHSSAINFILDKSVTSIVSILAFTCVYKLIPSRKVSFKNALIAGFIAGVIFEISKKIFIADFALLFFNYHVIYGSLAFVPLFLIWIYVSCFNLLFCAEIIYELEKKTTH